MSSTLAERIIEARKIAGLSQRSLAKLLNVSAPAVQKWENGQHIPDSLSLEKMADIFGVSTDWLLGRSDLLNYHDCKQYLMTEQNPLKLAELIAIAASQMKKSSVEESSRVSIA